MNGPIMEDVLSCKLCSTSSILLNELQFQSVTLAGTPIADVIFIIAFARVLRRARASLHAAGLCYSVEADGAAEYFGVAFDDGAPTQLGDSDYMDDRVFPVFAAAPELAARVSDATVIIVETLLGMALQ